MPTSSELLSPLRIPMNEIGFRKRSSEIYTQGIGPGVLAWIGFNSARRHLSVGSILVHPVVGVRHQEVERLVADMTGRPNHPYIPPTVSKPLRSLATIRDEWVLTSNSALDDVVGNVMTAITTAGMAFISEHQSLSSLLDAARQGMGFGEDYRIPAILFLQGETRLAEAEINSQLKAMGTRMDPAAVNYRSFAERLKKLISQS